MSLLILAECVPMLNSVNSTCCLHFCYLGLYFNSILLPKSISWNKEQCEIQLQLEQCKWKNTTKEHILLLHWPTAKPRDPNRPYPLVCRWPGLYWLPWPSPGTTADQFHIEPTAGTLHVAPGARLDRESTPEHRLRVVAQDNPVGDQPPRRAYAKVRRPPAPEIAAAGVGMVPKPVDQGVCQNSARCKLI